MLVCCVDWLFENTDASETISFTVEVPEPFLTTLAITASAASAAVVGVGLVAYLETQAIGLSGFFGHRTVRPLAAVPKSSRVYSQTKLQREPA